MADDKPGFGDAPSFISDIQMDHAVSDDKQAITIRFAGFTATIVPNGPPVVMETLTIVLPLKNVASGATVTGALQGGGAMNPGIGAMLIFRAGGKSQVFDPLFNSPDDIGFMKEINLPVPANGDLRITIILALEASATDPKAGAQINMSTLDLTIGPPQAPIRR